MQQVEFSAPVPKYKFYQGAKALYGKKWFNRAASFRANQFWSAEHFKKANKVTNDETFSF